MIALTIDRFEGRRKEVAVLLTGDGRSINLPRDLLPKGAREGDVLSMTLGRDPSSTASIAGRTKALRAELDKTDPGGDIKL